MEIFFLFVFYLSAICYFYDPKRPSHPPIIIVIIFFAEIKDQMQIMTFVLHIKSKMLLDLCIMWF